MRLCAEADGLCERGFPLGHRNADRGIRAGQPVEGDLYAVVAVAKELARPAAGKFDGVRHGSLIAGRGEVPVAVVGPFESQQHAGPGGEVAVFERIEQVIVLIPAAARALRMREGHRTGVRRGLSDERAARGGTRKRGGGDTHFPRIAGGKLGGEARLNGDLGHATPQRHGHVGGRARRCERLGGRTAHHEAAGTLGPRAHFGERTVVIRRIALHQGQQFGLAGKTIERTVRHDVELAGGTGGGVRNGERSAFRCQFGCGELSVDEQAAFGIENQSVHGRERLLPRFGGGRRIEERFDRRLLRYEAQMNLGCGRRIVRSFRIDRRHFFAGAQQCERERNEKEFFHGDKIIEGYLKLGLLSSM